jgi:23S rRNA (guanosine2251-2'-O)-methyltransferase
MPSKKRTKSQQPGSGLVLGRIPVLEALRARKRTPRKLWLLDGAQGVEGLLEAAGAVTVKRCDRRTLDDKAGGAVHQGVVLEATPLPALDLQEWLGRDLPADCVAVVLDGVEDPHNFGAIARTASATGAASVVFAKDRAAPLSPAALKSAAGAMEYVDLIEVTNIARSLERLKEAGFWTAALDASGDQSLWDADLKGRIALVIGGEGGGVRRLVLETCDFRLRIPIAGPITSLNASVSAGIALAECLRQRAERNGV